MTPHAEHKHVERKLEELSPTDLSHLLAKRRVLLVDVREPDEYAAQRIAGAVLYPLTTLDVTMLPPDGEVRVVFQCGSGKRSETAARARLAAGAPHAAHLAGGIGAWLKAGLPVLRLDPSSGKISSTRGGAS